MAYALGMDGMRLLECEDVVELATLNSILQHALEARRNLDREHANIILEGINKMLGG